MAIGFEQTGRLANAAVALTLDLPDREFHHGLNVSGNGCPQAAVDHEHHGMSLQDDDEVQNYRESIERTGGLIGRRVAPGPSEAIGFTLSWKVWPL